MKPQRFVMAVLVAAALLAAARTTVNAYATYGKWGSLTVEFFVNPANADVSSSKALAALQAGMNTWNSQSGTALRLGYAGPTSDTTTAYDNKNVIIFRGVSNGSTIATTYAWSANGVLVDTDIVFWDGGFKFFTGSSGCKSGAYIEDIAAHELGHAMGLSHSTSSSATMYSRYSTCSKALRTLSSDDINGIKKLYAKGAGTVDTPPAVTIQSPANGASVDAGKATTFLGSALDSPDGDISSRLVWTSNLDGQIGTGQSVAKALRTGTHTITATVKDSIGYTTAHAIVVYVK